MRPVGDGFKHKADKHGEDGSGGVSRWATAPSHAVMCPLLFCPCRLFISSIHPLRKPNTASPRPAFIQGSLHTRYLLLLYRFSYRIILTMTQIQLPHTAPLGEEGKSQNLGASQPLCCSSSLYPQTGLRAAAHCCASRTCSSFNLNYPLNVDTPSAHVGTLRVRDSAYNSGLETPYLLAMVLGGLLFICT